MYISFVSTFLDPSMVRSETPCQVVWNAQDLFAVPVGRNNLFINAMVDNPEQ